MNLFIYYCGCIRLCSQGRTLDIKKFGSFKQRLKYVGVYYYPSVDEKKTMEKSADVCSNKNIYLFVFSKILIK